MASATWVATILVRETACLEVADRRLVDQRPCGTSVVAGAAEISLLPCSG